jgi:hypothetical protein
MPKIDQYTKALFHFNGTNGQQILHEEVTNTNLTTSSFTNSNITSSNAKFSQSLYSAGLISASAQEPYFQFGNDNWTIEFWGRYETDIGTPYWVDLNSIQILYNNGWFAVYQIDNTGTLREGNGHRYTTIADNTWRHYAIQRSGSYIQVYQDGTLKDGNASPVYQLYPSASYRKMDGNGGKIVIDELKVDVGIARYTASFTPPTEEYYIYDSYNISTNITSSFNTDASIIGYNYISTNITSSFDTTAKLIDSKASSQIISNITLTNDIELSIKRKTSTNINAVFNNSVYLLGGEVPVNTIILNSITTNTPTLWLMTDETEKLNVILYGEILYPIITEELE